MRRRLHHYVLLGALLIGVIGACGEEQQRAAYPHFTRVVRQVMHANAIGRRHHYVARALGAIPVATRVEVILATVRHAVIAVWETVDDITGAMLRAWAPAIAMTVGATWPTVIVGMVIAWTRTRATGLPMPVVIVASGDITVITRARLLGLAHRIGPALDRQVMLRPRPTFGAPFMLFMLPLRPTPLAR